MIRQRPVGWLSWTTVGISVTLLGGLWSAAQAADESQRRRGGGSARAPAAFEGLAPRQHLLVTWTVRLASMQLAQYPPGYGTPDTY